MSMKLESKHVSRTLAIGKAAAEDFTEGLGEKSTNLTRRSIVHMTDDLQNGCCEQSLPLKGYFSSLISSHKTMLMLE